METSPATRWRPTLEVFQVARGLAAAAVAAFHLSQLMSREYPGLDRPFWGLTQHGHLGVQFFFALSGFIILYVHAVDMGNPARVFAYLRNRFVRIYPLYWIVLVGATAGILLKNADGLSDMNGVVDWVSQFTLLKLSTSRVVVGHAWTLFHEVFFYLLFALAILNRRVGMTVLAVWFTGMLFFWEPQTQVHELKDVLVGINNLFFFAGMAAFVLTSRLSSKAAWGALLTGVFLLIVGATNEDKPLIFAIPSTFTWIAAFTLIIAGACAVERTRQLGRIPPVLVYLGDASYSIYLLHWHFETYALRALHKVFTFDNAYAPAVWLVLLLLSLGAGFIAYWFIERPLLALFKRGRAARHSPAAVSSPQ